MANYRVTFKEDILSHEKKTGVFGNVKTGRQGEDSFFPFIYGPNAKPGTWQNISAKKVAELVGVSKDPVAAIKAKVVREGKNLGYDVADGDIEVKSDGKGGVQVKIDEKPRKLNAEQKVILRSRVDAKAKEKSVKHSDHLSHREEINVPSNKVTDKEEAEKAKRTKELLRELDELIGHYNSFQVGNNTKKVNRGALESKTRAKQIKILAELKELDPKTYNKVKDIAIV